MSQPRISCLAAVVVFLAGCGGSRSITSGPPTTGPTASVEATLPAARQVTLDVIVLTSVSEDGAQVAATSDAIWVGDGDRLYKIDPASNKVAFDAATSSPARRFAIAEGAAWVGDFDKSLVRRVELATGTEATAIVTGVNPEFVVAAFGSIWTADHRGGTVTRIDPVKSKVIATVQGIGSTGPGGPQGMAAGPDRIWVGVSNVGSIFEIDPATNRNVRSIVGSGVAPCGPILVDAMIWVSACGESPHVSRFDPGAGTAVWVKLPGYAGAPVRIGDRVWVPAVGIGDPVLIALSPSDGDIVDVVSLPEPAGADSAVVAFGSLWLVDSESGTVLRIPTTELNG